MIWFPKRQTALPVIKVGYHVTGLMGKWERKVKYRVRKSGKNLTLLVGVI